MSANIVMPEKKNSTKGLFQVAGTAVGAYFGGPAGAAAGHSAGGALSETISPTQQQQSVQSTAPGSAIDRRVGAQQAQSNPSGDLAAAEAATAKLSPEMQKEYMPAIQRARALDAQQRRTME